MPRSSATKAADELYAKLKAAKAAKGGVDVHPSDLTHSLESSVRRRAKADGYGLSVMRPRSDVISDNTVTLILFKKGTPAPGRTEYVRLAPQINSRGRVLVVGRRGTITVTRGDV